MASYLMLAKKILFGTSLSSFRRAFSPIVPPVFLKVTRLVFLRLTRISTVCVVARRMVMGSRVLDAVKGRVLVAVKRRRRSVRILLAACGDGVIVVYGRGDGVRLLFSAAGSVASSARDALRMGAALLGVKRRITSVVFYNEPTTSVRGGG